MHCLPHLAQMNTLVKLLQLQHMVCKQHMPKQAGESDEVQIAGLMHDIGHLLALEADKKWKWKMRMVKAPKLSIMILGAIF